MELFLNPEDLKKKSLFVATPQYGGMNYGLYMKSCLELQNLCTQYGVQVKFSFLFNESLITRARNYLVDEFIYRSDCTHMLFIDSDISFDPQDVIALLALDKEVSGAPYPKKSIKWANIKKAILKHPEIEPGQLADLIGDYVFNPVHGTHQFNVVEPLEVLEIGTGFMMIKKDVFLKFKDAYPETHYKPDHLGQANFGGDRYIHAFFDCYIDRGEGSGNTDRYLSEDYAFCQRWRRIGGQIWLCPWMKLIHCGSFMFSGNLPMIAQTIGEI